MLEIVVTYPLINCITIHKPEGYTGQDSIIGQLGFKSALLRYT